MGGREPLRWPRTRHTRTRLSRPLGPGPVPLIYLFYLLSKVATWRYNVQVDFLRSHVAETAPFINFESFKFWHGFLRPLCAAAAAAGVVCGGPRAVIQLGRNGSRRRVVCCSHGGCSSFSVGQVHLRVPDTAEGKLGPLIGVMRALILARPGGRNLVSTASGGAPVTATCPPFVP